MIVFSSLLSENNFPFSGGNFKELILLMRLVYDFNAIR